MLGRFLTIPRLLVIIGVLLVVLIAAMVLHRHDSSPVAVPPTASNTLPSMTIQNIADFPAIHKQFVTGLQYALYAQTKQSVSNIPGSYYGVIRAGSITTSQTTQVVGDDVDVTVPVTVTTFVIDVPAAHRTYEGQTYQDQYGEVAQAYVLCPTAAQNNYGAFHCVNQP